jgi:hypothetical protein
LEEISQLEDSPLDPLKELICSSGVLILIFLFPEGTKSQGNESPFIGPLKIGLRSERNANVSSLPVLQLPEGFSS